MLCNSIEDYLYISYFLLSLNEQDSNQFFLHSSDQLLYHKKKSISSPFYLGGKLARDHIATYVGVIYCLKESVIPKTRACSCFLSYSLASSSN